MNSLDPVVMLDSCSRVPVCLDVVYWLRAGGCHLTLRPGGMTLIVLTACAFVALTFGNAVIWLRGGCMTILVTPARSSTVSVTVCITTASIFSATVAINAASSTHMGNQLTSCQLYTYSTIALHMD